MVPTTNILPQDRRLAMIFGDVSVTFSLWPAGESGTRLEHTDKSRQLALWSGSISLPFVISEFP